MTDLDPTPLLFQLDLASLFSLFWYVILFDLPRYTLGFLAVACSSSLRPDAARPVSFARPLVTVVLAGHNERGIVRRCVRSLREQTYDRLEIICVDDGSSDGMGRELRRLRDDHLIHAALSTSLRCGKSSAVNLGVACAHGELIVITDWDCTFDRDAVAQLIVPFTDPTVGAVCGNIGVRNVGASVVTGLQNIEYLLSISVGKRLLDMFDQVSCASGALAAFRRRALTECGGLDVGPGEDLDLTLRLRSAGWKIRFAETAWCLTDVPDTVLGLIKQRLRWERDALRLRLRKHRRSLDPRSSSESTAELLHQLEFVLSHLLGAVAFPLYLVWLLEAFGTGALTVFALVTLVYFGLDPLAALCALVIVDRARGRMVLPYIPIYGVFQAFLMRAVRLVAYVQEWVFEASRGDAYVPARIARMASHR